MYVYAPTYVCMYVVLYVACVQETQGVTVATYGPTRDFPAFFSQRSGFLAPFNVETPRQCAMMIGEWNSGEGGGSCLGQGRIEPPKAARGHATSNSANTDSIVLNVTKNRDPRTACKTAHTVEVLIS